MRHALWDDCTERYIRAPWSRRPYEIWASTKTKISTMERLDNVSPEVFAKSQAREDLPEAYDDAVVDPIDAREIFGELRILDLLRLGESAI